MLQIGIFFESLNSMPFNRIHIRGFVLVFLRSYFDSEAVCMQTQLPYIMFFVPEIRVLRVITDREKALRCLLVLKIHPLGRIDLSRLDIYFLGRITNAGRLRFLVHFGPGLSIEFLLNSHYNLPYNRETRMVGDKHSPQIFRLEFCGISSSNLTV